MDNSEIIPVAPPIPNLLTKGACVYRSKTSKLFESLQLHFLINSENDLDAQKYIESHDPSLLNQTVYGMTPLVVAIDRRNFKIARLLVKHGCNIDSKPSTSPHVKHRMYPIHMAALSEDTQLLRMMLDRDPCLIQSADTLALTPLHYAASEGRLENVRLLISLGAHINARDDRGKTCLILACESNHMEVAKELIEEGASLYAADYAGWTPIFSCVVTRSLPMLRFLLEQGSSVTTVDIRGRTMLHAACSSHDAYNLERLCLMNMNAAMRISKATTDTMRRLLSRNKHEDSAAIIKLLLNHPDTNINIKDTYGKTALQYAAEDGLFSIVAMLLDEGADLSQEAWLYNSLDWPMVLVNNAAFSDWLCLNRERGIMSLSRLCRRVIRKNSRWNIDDNVERLPLPLTMKEFLKLRKPLTFF